MLTTAEQGGTSLISSRYCLIPGDLRDFESDIAPKLLELLDTSTPTLFLAECVFIYLDPSHGSNILRWSVEQFGKAGIMTVLYDPVGLDDNFGRVMVNNLQVGHPKPGSNALSLRYRREASLCSDCQQMHLYKLWKTGSKHTASARLWLKTSKASERIVYLKMNSEGSSNFH